MTTETRVENHRGPEHLLAALAALVRTAGSGFTVDDLLHELCEVAVRDLGADAAGAMLVRDAKLCFVHAHPETVIPLERLQETLRVGPCWSSARRQEAVIVPNIEAVDRWPKLTRLAVLAGLHSMVAIPLLADGRTWGVLDLYRSAPANWTEHDLATARLFSDLAATYVAMAINHEQDLLGLHELEHRATHDELTGLPNRALLFDRLEHALGSAARHGTAVAVLFVDIDRFKEINDTLGHAAGDRALIEVTRRLHGTMRDCDTLARLSGDEFVVICEDLDGSPSEVQGALNLLGRRIQDQLRWSVTTPVGELDISVSIGVAVAASDSRTAQALITEADWAMYRAKQGGRGQLVISSRGFGL